MDFFNIVFDYVFVIQLLTVCVALVIVYPFKKNWKSVLKVTLHICVLFIFGTLLNWGLFELSHVFRFLAGINFPIAWLFIILGYSLFRRQPLVNRFLIGSTMFVTAFALIALGRQLMKAIPDNYFPDSANLLICVFIIFYSIVLHKMSLKEYIDLPIPSVIMMFIINVSIAVVLISKEAYDVKNYSETVNIIYVLILIGFYITSICTYLMLYFYAKARKSMVQLEVENKLLEADQERIESFEKTREEFHLIRHDINNQMSIMQIMLENKEYDKLQDFFNSMNNSFIADKKYDFYECGNSIIDSVINMELLKAIRANLELKANINVPSELPFEKSDISRVLVNIIDNSIEALERIDDNDPKVVNVSILTHGDYLYIGINNRISKLVDPDHILKMNTEKEDQVNHGFGQKIIKKIANKYNGHVNYSIEDGVFYAEIMLDTKFAVQGVK